MMAAALMSCTLFPDLSLPFSDLRIARHGERDALHTLPPALTLRHKRQQFPTCDVVNDQQPVLPAQ
jgi:hypothetical protein